MADDSLFLVHKRSGLAICFAKQTGNDWHQADVTAPWNTLVDYLNSRLDLKPSEAEHHAYWDGYLSGQNEFVLVQETLFGKAWSTPSGELWCRDDFIRPVPGGYGEPRIFRIVVHS